jgi:hypothetical protein
MSRTTQIPIQCRTLVFAVAALVIGLDVFLVSRGDAPHWLLAAVLGAFAVVFALNATHLSRLSTVSLCEFPLVASVLLLDPAMATAVGILAGIVPRGRLGNVSRALNVVCLALPMLLASTALRLLEDGLGLASPVDAPFLWFCIALIAVAVDNLGHATLHGLWNRAAYGLPIVDWFRDMVVPGLKNDPISGVVVILLVEIGWLLDGTARVLPAVLGLVAIGGMWLVLQTTRRQVEARELKDDFFRAIFVSLARLLEMKDPETAYHSARVAVFSRDIARVMGLSEEEQGRIHLAGLLHDVGKVGVPDEILLKPGRLSDEERAIMQRHARLSAEAIQGIPGFGDLVRTVYAHHERVDGSGYPEGIRGDELPIGARILGVADTFEALTSDRPYRNGRPALEALEVFERECELFDPDVVEALRYLVLSGSADYSYRKLTDFSDEWSRAARHLEVRLEEDAFVLPPEKPSPAAGIDFPAVSPASSKTLATAEK